MSSTRDLNNYQLEVANLISEGCRGLCDLMLPERGRIQGARGHVPPPPHPWS